MGQLTVGQVGLVVNRVPLTVDDDVNNKHRKESHVLHTFTSIPRLVNQITSRPVAGQRDKTVQRRPLHGPKSSLTGEQQSDEETLLQFVAVKGEVVAKPTH